MATDSTSEEPSWCVEKLDGPDDIVATCGDTMTGDVRASAGSGQQCFARAVGWRQALGRKHFFCKAHAAGELAALPKQPILRATALTSGGSMSDVVTVLEAETPGALQLEIQRSGLVTSVEAAMSLGALIERVWRP
jgi:hypothetical protein